MHYFYIQSLKAGGQWGDMPPQGEIMPLNTFLIFVIILTLSQWVVFPRIILAMYCYCKSRQEYIF
jgi:heme/copper-type cytochrome/quinol oxidase subunit 2